VIVDSSAILAILFDEPEREDFLQRILGAPSVGVGAPTLVETSVVLSSRLGDAANGVVSGWVERAGLVVVSFDATHWSVAADAWLRFGRGRHPAALNLGDCLAYATARVSGRPLLCKGEDFRQTDLALV
jgi:ribonuclease VapC